MLDYILEHRKSIGASLLAACLITAGIFSRDQLQANAYINMVPVRVTKMILAEQGGEIRLTGLNGAYDYFLKIPPGALESDTKVTLETNTEDKAALRLQPEGLKLVKPAVLTMVIKPILLNVEIKGQTGIHFYDPESSTWCYNHGLTYETVDGHITSDTLIREFAPQMLGGSDPVQKWSYEDHYN